MDIKILMIIAPKDFRDEEYFIPKEIFLKEHFHVTTASLNVSVATGKLGKTTNIDLDISEIEINKYNCICFIGGSGALIYKNNEIIKNIIINSYNQNKLICAICIAPILLAESGILKNKNATVYNNENKEQEIILKNNGANYINKNVVIDSNIITANGPHAAEEFAKEIIKKLKK